jgi:hypothetical protein
MTTPFTPHRSTPWGSLQPPGHQPSPIAPWVVPASWYNQHNGNTSTSETAACYRALADNWYRAYIRLKALDDQQREAYQRGVAERLDQQRAPNARFTTELRRLEYQTRRPSGNPDLTDSIS